MPSLRHHLTSRQADPVRWVAVALATATALFLCTDAGRALLLRALPRALEGSGAAGPLVFVVAFAAAVALLLPVLPFVFVGAVAFGWWEGTLLNVVGGLAGACLGFGAARVLGDRFVQRALPARTWRRVETVLERSPAHAVFLLRVLPLFPYSATSFALGLTPVRFGAFVRGTLAGSVPLTLAYTWLFARAGAVLRRPGFHVSELLTLEAVVPLATVVAMLVLGALLRRRIEDEDEREAA